MWLEWKDFKMSEVNSALATLLETLGSVSSTHKTALHHLGFQFQEIQNEGMPRQIAQAGLGRIT